MAWRLYEYEPPRCFYYQLLKDRKAYIERIEYDKKYDRRSLLEDMAVLSYIELLIEKYRRGFVYDWQ